MTRHHLRGTLANLDAEWHHLVDSNPLEPLAWRRDCPAFAAASGLAGALAAIADDPDTALLHLLAAHAAGDLVAGRVVLQALLGKLVRMALVDEVACLDDYLAAAWERIATYPLIARPHRVAANLTLDTLKAVKREQRTPALAAADVGAGRNSGMRAEQSGSRDAGVVLRAALDAGVLDAAAAAALAVVYLEGRSGSDAAGRLGSTPGAVRVRCHRAVRALREHAAELAMAIG